MTTSITSQQIRDKDVQSVDLADTITINSDSASTGSFIVNGTSGLLFSSSAGTGNVVIAGNVPESLLAMGASTDAILLTGSSIDLRGGTTIEGGLEVEGSGLELSGSLSLTGSFSSVGDMFVTGTLYVEGNEVEGTTRILGELQMGDPVGRVQLGGITTVTNSLVKPTSHVFLQKQTCGSPGAILALTVGTGQFHITSSYASDADWVSYLIINPA